MSTVYSPWSSRDRTVFGVVHLISDRKTVVLEVPPHWTLLVALLVAWTPLMACTLVVPATLLVAGTLVVPATLLAAGTLVVPATLLVAGTLVAPATLHVVDTLLVVGALVVPATLLVPGILLVPWTLLVTSWTLLVEACEPRTNRVGSGLELFPNSSRLSCQREQGTHF